nr:196_t:CDS:2 [Entrophospora candida]
MKVYIIILISISILVTFYNIYKSIKKSNPLKILYNLSGLVFYATRLIIESNHSRPTTNSNNNNSEESECDDGLNANIIAFYCYIAIDYATMIYVGARVFGYLKKNLGYLKTNLGENHQRYKAFKTFSRWNLSILLLALIQISFINIDDYGHYISFDEKIRSTIKTLIYIIISSLINLNFDSYYKLKNEDIATNNQGRIFVKNDLETNPPQDVIIPPLAHIRSSGSFSAKSSASSESNGQQFYTTVEELGDGREAVVSLKQLTFDEILFSVFRKK